MLHAGSQAGALRPGPHGPGFRTALCSSSATFLKPPSLQQPQGGVGVVPPNPDPAGDRGVPKMLGLRGQGTRGPSV